MRQISTIVLGSLASLAVIGTAEAGVYLGHTSAAGAVTVIPAANDLPAVADIQTLWIKITDTSGATIPLTLNAALTATYTSGGATTFISLTPIGPTQMTFKIQQSTPAGGKGIRRVEFGTVNSRAGFDIVNGAIRTAGSGFGNPPVATALLGAWTSQILFTNTVSLGGAAPQNDLFKTMVVDYPTPMFNGVFEFIVDVDRLY
jgi:hypothetical protein